MVSPPAVSTPVSSTVWRGNIAVAEHRATATILSDIDFLSVDRATVMIPANVNLARGSRVSVASVSGAGVGINSGSEESNRAKGNGSNYFFHGFCNFWLRKL